MSASKTSYLGSRTHSELAIPTRLVMSFRRPKLHYKRRIRPATAAPSTESVPASQKSADQVELEDGGPLISVSDVPRTKRPRHSTALFLPGPEELITLPGRVALTQLIISDVRDVGSSEGKSTRGHSSTSTQYAASGSNDPQVTAAEPLNDNWNPPDDDWNPPDDWHMPSTDGDDGSSRRQAAHRKRARQRSNWLSRLPLLLPLHLRLLRETQSFRNPPSPPSFSCPCTSRRLTVICLYFQRE